MKIIKTRKASAALAAVAILVSGAAFAGSKADIHVMTQNQYLGADLGPIIAAGSLQEVNAAMIQALIEVSNNNIPERVQALAESISDKQPHLVALQEIYSFDCFDPFGSGQCEHPWIAGARNDHLELTLAALGDQYTIAAQVQNLTLAPSAQQPQLFGIPVSLDANLPPVFIQVIDRDVILARSDVTAVPVDFGCARPSLDGCNFVFVADVSVAGIPIKIERGFVAVDTMIGGASYRFVNTHLEVKQPSSDPASAALQPLQASELLGTVLGAFNPSQRLIVAGDFNSSPADVSPLGWVTAYEQFANGKLYNGSDLPLAFTDTWNLRPGHPDGFTCCELADLSNAPSLHYERIDLVFALPAPGATVKANVLDAEVDDKTLSGLWPSDHASVSAELTY